uniref:Cytochrome P450 705A35 n=1 Tax=Isatis tinctoria TaxID=161756 RepID=A0A8H2S9B3_ISATI|nr:cytochrome P450 705A35 [Isatis tinctoria]
MILLIPLCCFMFLCYFFKKTNDSRVGRDLPPSPLSLPIIGHLHLLLSSLAHKSLQKLSSRYGSLLHLQIFNAPFILVSSVAVAHEIFSTHDVNVSFRGVPAIDESLLFGSHGVINAPCGDYWKFMKKLMVTKLLGPHAQEKSRGIRAGELDRFYKNLLEKARKKETVEMAKEAMKLTNNIMCRMVMGRSLSEEDDEAERLKGLVTESSDLMKRMFLAVLFRRQLKKLGISLFKNNIMGVSNRFDEMLERILAEHKEKPEKDQGTDMMDMLLAAYRDEKAEYKITRNHIKAFFVELFLGGIDTSSTTIQLTMAEIINNPNTRMIQETDMPNLPYLQVVIKETLRLHPPGPLLPREFQQGCEIGGFYVPEKTRLVVNAYVLMRDPDFWVDSLEFKPERFLASSKAGQDDERKEKALKYLPFGGGRRGCPGSNLGYVMVGTAIGMMVQGFEWRIKGDKVNMEEAMDGIMLTMAHPLKLTPLTRYQQ